MKKNIVVLGGGFGGLISAMTLHKKLSSSQLDNYQIILVDKNDHHLYHPNIYKVAALEEDSADLEEAKATAAYAYEDFLPKDIQFIQANITEIDQEASTVTVQGFTEDINGYQHPITPKTIPFTYCVVALGSENAFYNIPGMKENALTLKTVADALRFRNALEVVVQGHREDMVKPVLHFVVGGAGFSGIEVASEMVNLLCLLAEKYEYPEDKFDITMIDAAPTIFFGQPTEIAANVAQRLRHLQIPINIATSAAATNVSDKTIALSNGEVLPYDVLVWTGGVKSVQAPFKENGEIDAKGRTPVDAYLHIAGHKNIFAVGDNALVLDANGKPLPQTGQQATAQGKYLGNALAQAISGEEPKAFMPEAQAFILPVAGKWAVVHFPNGFTMYGFIPWVMHQYASFRYMCNFMPFWKAFGKAWRAAKLFSLNDW